MWKLLPFQSFPLYIMFLFFLAAFNTFSLSLDLGNLILMCYVCSFLISCIRGLLSLLNPWVCIFGEFSAFISSNILCSSLSLLLRDYLTTCSFSTIQWPFFLPFSLPSSPFPIPFHPSLFLSSLSFFLCFVCYILDSCYACVFNFTTLFFWNVLSAVSPI